MSSTDAAKQRAILNAISKEGGLLAGLDRHDRLTAHADVFRQLLLRHLTVPESKLPNNVSKGHDSPSPAVQTERHGGGGDLRCSHTGQ